MPTAATHTWHPGLQPLADAEDAHLMPVVLTVGAAYAAGLVLGQVAADGKFGVYADGGGGGLDVARCILAIPCVVTAAGLHIWGTTATLTTGEQGETHGYAMAYYSGTFACASLTGLTAAAVADLGKLVSGDVNTGTLVIPA